MKKVIAWLLVLALTAAVSIGATLAYLTDTDEDVNVMTLGKVKIDQLEYERIDDESKDEDAKVREFHDNKPLYPGVYEDGFDFGTKDNYVNWEQIGKDGYTSGIWNPDEINNEVDKMVFVKNKGDYDAYVRSVFAFEAGKYTTLDEFRSMVHLNLNETDYTWEWTETPVTIGESTYFVATATYNKVLAPGALTEISLSQIALDKTATNEDVEAFGETYQVLVKSQGIQADGFEDPDFALTEGFGVIDANNIPWETDNAIQGIDLKTALHYLDGDVNGTKITTQVNSVTFGLNKDYADIVDSYTGILIDVEQDVPVYAYYVKNGSGYDVYFLANDEIYTPVDSQALFRDMTSLTTINSDNLNTGRTEIFTSMLRDCTALTNLDTTDWDTSSAENMSYMFYGCSNLENLDVSNFDTSKVKDMSFMFKACYKLETLDVSKWDTGNCVYFNSIFSGVSGKPMKLQGVDVSNWDMSNAQKIGYMFYGNENLVSIDLSKWDVSNVVDVCHMFTDCINLTTINFDGWDTSNVKNFGAMFNDCDSLVVLDVSDFDTQSAENFDQVFESCDNLEQIIGLNNWDTSNVWDFWEMFQGSKSLKELDLSSFNTSKVQCTKGTFNGCSSLKTIYVGDGWDMSNVWEDSSYMFTGCTSLVGGNGTTYQGTDLKYACVDTEETPGYLTYKAAEKAQNP